MAVRRAPKQDQLAGISSEAVEARTGRTWADWLRTLDKEGCRSMKHAEIATLLHERFEVGPWWSQMVTVGYEQARGMREKHEKPDGYSVSASKTIAIPIDQLYSAWSNARSRVWWLADAPIDIRRSTKNKSMRIVWTEDDTKVDVNFYSRGESKSQVAIEHSKIGSARVAEARKKWWRARLGDLAELIRE